MKTPQHSGRRLRWPAHSLRRGAGKKGDTQAEGGLGIAPIAATQIQVEGDLYHLRCSGPNNYIHVLRKRRLESFNDSPEKSRSARFMTVAATELSLVSPHWGQRNAARAAPACFVSHLPWALRRPGQCSSSSVAALAATPRAPGSAAGTDRVESLRPARRCTYYHHVATRPADTPVARHSRYNPKHHRLADPPATQR